MVLLMLAASTAAATAGGPKERHTTVDMQLAGSVLLAQADLHMWSARSPKPTVDPLTCSQRLTPTESDLVESGSAYGPFLAHGSKEALAQSVHVYANTSQANAAWARRTLKKMVLCMQRRLEDSSTMMSWISVVKWQKLELPQLVPHVVGYRVIGDAQAGRQKAKVYLDLLLLGRDRTLTMLVATSYDKAVPKSFEQKLVRTISERLLAT
jgi:hypothetical protein